MKWFTAVFPIGVAILDIGAAACYAWNGNYRLAAVWTLYAGAAVLLGGL